MIFWNVCVCVKFKEFIKKNQINFKDWYFLNFYHKIHCVFIKIIYLIKININDILKFQLFPSNWINLLIEYALKSIKIIKKINQKWKS